jgi:hypothetical protein
MLREAGTSSRTAAPAAAAPRRRLDIAMVYGMFGSTMAGCSILLKKGNKKHPDPGSG